MPVPRMRPLRACAWPKVLGALAAVAALVVVMLGVDLVVAQRVGRRTAEIVENSQRSIELVDDLRAQAHRLVVPDRTPEEMSCVVLKSDRGRRTRLRS